jgi:hypothetical protein
MKRIKIFKVYFILWLFVYFIAISNIEIFKLYFLSTLTFNIAIVAILSIGSIMLLKGAKDVVMLAGTFGVLMYKKRNLPFYIRGIEKVLPSNIADKISSRAKNELLFFTQQEKEEILSWIDEQFANQNKYNNFFIGTVLMIGLLGTFSGLLGAIGSMANIVNSLSGSNIDIGKIMAGFSGPLSSMAVGFGSSLFGVISAILLSIKGYLLNRAQASVLDGVENWLNAKTVDTLQVAQEDVAKNGEEIIEKQPGFMDIFVEKMGALQHEIKMLNENNKILQEAFSKSLQSVETMQKDQQKTVHYVTEALQALYRQSANHMQQSDKIVHTMEANAQNQSQFLSKLVDLQQNQTYRLTDLNTQLEDLTYITQKNQKAFFTLHENLLERLAEKNSSDDKIALFQVADAIDALHKDLDTKIGHIDKILQNSSGDAKVSQKDETPQTFLHKHFAFKRNIKEETK